MKMNKTVALVLALTLVIGVAVGGTLAWLMDKTDEVVNTFSPSTIGITLEETGTTTEADGTKTKSFDMVPGWTIDKDPVVTVDANSEDCWLFVEITESTTPDLDAYIAYAIADGWTKVEGTETDSGVVIGRKVYQDDDTKSFSILGAGSVSETINNVEYTVSWEKDQVGVKPSVTEAMMEAITGEGKAQPTLTFKAYATQLFKANSDDVKNNTADEFEMADAWALAKTQNTTTP